jgi:transposase-like protein
MRKPVTLQQAIVYFGDPDRAFEYAKWLRWPDGKVICPRCDREKVSFVNGKTKKGGTRKLWFCNGCKKQFTLKVGTIFEDSPITLDKWMTAFWMICNCKNGISSYELHRSLGVSQKSAWFMLHRIRVAMKAGTFAKFGGEEGGPVEVDETFVGPNTRHMHASKLAKRKLGMHYQLGVPVMGMLDRELRHVRAKVVSQCEARDIAERDSEPH